MATQLRIKRRTADATAPTGLTAGEMAINLADKKLYIGGTAGTNTIFLDSTAVAGLGTANTFTAVNTFSAGITVSGGNLNAVNINTTGSVSINNTPATLATTTVGTANVFNTVATSLGIGGAATAITMGASTGTINIRNPTIQVGNTVATITTASGTGNTLTVSPFGSVVIAPTSTAVIGGTRASLTVTNTDQGGGTVSVSGGNLYLGVGSLWDGDVIYNNAPVNIVFEGATNNANKTTLTVTEPTALRTITLPDATGTVALTATSVSSAVAGTGISVSGATGAVTITNIGVQTFNGLTGAVTGITAGGANTFTALQTFSAGISASGATFSGPIISTGYQISSGAINAQIGSYTLVAGDNGKIVTMNVGSANNLTVPASLAVGFNCTVIQLGAGQTTILASGTTLNSYQGYLKISGQHGSASIVGYTSNVYNVAGSLSA